MTDDLLRLTDALRARLEACAADPCLLTERDVRLALEEAGLALEVASPEALPRADGTVRQAHYGAGPQPWDTILDMRWAAQFAAANVLKYLRRTKQPVHSLASARWYWQRLQEMRDGTLYPQHRGDEAMHRNAAGVVRAQLLILLTAEERLRLGTDLA